MHESRLFGSDRMFDLDSLAGWEELSLGEFWPSDERPSDPKAWVIRQVMKDHLKPSHREYLEAHFFEGKSVTEIAKENNRTRRAVRSMLQRALEAMRKALRDHALDYREVPEDER